MNDDALVKGEAKGEEVEGGTCFENGGEGEGVRGDLGMEHGSVGEEDLMVGTLGGKAVDEGIE